MIRFQTKIPGNERDSYTTSEATSRAQDSDETNALYMVATTLYYIF
jgi:hypothetical protein